MKLVANALLPVVEGDLRRTIGNFASFIREHCTFDRRTACSLSLITTRGDLSTLVARTLPPDTGDFENCDRRVRKMTAAEFLAQSTTTRKGDNCACNVMLTDSLSQDQIVQFLGQLADAVPPSGRSLFLILFINGAAIRGTSSEVRARVTLNRAPKGRHRYGSYLFCEFDANSKRDAVAKQTVQQLTQALGVEFKKLTAARELDRPGRPSASEMVVLEQCIQEAFAQATADLDRANIPLNGGPRLYSPVAALYKRMSDVSGGIAEKIDFGAAMRHFIRVHFPDYTSCSANGSGPAFRKSLADHLTGVIAVQRDGGFGKSFTLSYGVDFPGTRFAGETLRPLLCSRGLLSLFHKGGLSPVWAYAVTADLDQALEGCGTVLRAALPVLEARLREFLSPVPESLPETISARGRLSAREAFEGARWAAKAWSPDARFLGVHSGGMNLLGYDLPRGVDLDGRLQPHGRWVVRFDSERLASDLLVVVPHTGKIAWDSMVQMAPLLCRPPSPGWLDSPAVMERAIEEIRRLAPGHEWKTWECGILEDHSHRAALWRIHVSFGASSRRPDLRDAYVHINPADGLVVHSLLEER